MLFSFYCAPSSFPLFVLFPYLFLLWQSPQYPFLPLAIFLRFPHPFFNVLRVLSQSPPRNQRSKRRKPPPQEADTGPFFFFFLLFLLYLFFLGSFPLFELYLLLQVLTQVLEILSSWFLRWLWDLLRLLNLKQGSLKLSRRLTVPQSLQVEMQQWVRI